MPHSALCRLDAIRVLSSADVWERVVEWWSGSGWLVNGMQGFRQSALLSSNPVTPLKRLGQPLSPVRYS